MTVLTRARKSLREYTLFYSLVKTGRYVTDPEGLVCWTRKITFISSSHKNAWIRVKRELKKLRQNHEREYDLGHPFDPGAKWTITTSEDCLHMVVPKE